MKIIRVIIVVATAVIIAHFSVSFATQQLVESIASRTGVDVVLSRPEGLGFDPRFTGSDPNVWQSFVALNAIDDAIAQYPQTLIAKYTPSILLTGDLLLLDFNIGGAAQPPDWVLMASSYIYVSSGPDFIEVLFHHEYSSLLLDAVPLDESSWLAQLPAQFNYPTTDAERLIATQNYTEDLTAFHAQGFVSDYGSSSLENDFNTYAELLFSDPAQLVLLAERIDLIRAKAQIVRDYYVALDPSFSKLFTTTGISDL